MEALFIVVWVVFMVAGMGGMVLGVAAIASAARLPAEAFGPWWDNTRTAWLLGLAVSFVIPFGLFITGLYWFARARPGFRATGQVPRPFWAGPPRPSPEG